MSAMYIAVDIGGTKTLVAAYSEEGDVLASEKNPTQREYPDFIKELTEVIHRVSGDQDVEAICVAAPGRINYEEHKVLSLGNLGWQDIDIPGDLRKEFDVPIHLDNDANLGAVGEANLGAGKDYRSVLYVTVSTGIGTGVCMDGKLPEVLRKSEGGSMHFRHDGEFMKWEHFASGKAFVERFGKMGKDVPEGDEAWYQFGGDVSLGIGSLVAVIEPDVVVIGGSMGTHLEKYRSSLLDALQRTRSVVVKIPPIVAAEQPEEAVINGCYVTCKQQSEN